MRSCVATIDPALSKSSVFGWFMKMRMFLGPLSAGAFTLIEWTLTACMNQYIYSWQHTLFYTYEKREKYLWNRFCRSRHPLLVLCACLNQNTRALLLPFFVFLTQRDMCKTRNLQHKHNMRREKRKKHGKIGESSKIERMVWSILFKVWALKTLKLKFWLSVEEFQPIQ